MWLTNSGNLSTCESQPRSTEAEVCVEKYAQLLQLLKLKLCGPDENSRERFIKSKVK